MISKNTNCLWRSLIFFYTISCGGNLKGAIFDKKLFGNTLSPHQNTDILSLDSSPGVPRPVLSETVFSTPSTKQAKLLFAPMYVYLSVSRSHPVLPHNKHLSNGHYDYDSVLQSFLKHVPISRKPRCKIWSCRQASAERDFPSGVALQWMIINVIIRMGLHATLYSEHTSDGGGYSDNDFED